MSTCERQLELAEAHQNRLLEDAIKQRRAAVPPAGELGPGECPECGEEIPMGRRKLGYRTCVHCASVSEKRR